MAELTELKARLDALSRQDSLAEFVANALDECARLEAGIDHLADSVYTERPATKDAAQSVSDRFADRIRFGASDEVLDLDFSGFVFDSTEAVNAFYDEVDRTVNGTGRKWYVIADHTNCRIWPEAWVAFAHRGKQATVTYSLATARFNARMQGVNTDPSMFESRGAALAYIDQLRGFTSD